MVDKYTKPTYDPKIAMACSLVQSQPPLATVEVKNITSKARIP